MGKYEPFFGKKIKISLRESEPNMKHKKRKQHHKKKKCFSFSRYQYIVITHLTIKKSRGGLCLLYFEMIHSKNSTSRETMSEKHGAQMASTIKGKRKKKIQHQFYKFMFAWNGCVTRPFNSQIDLNPTDIPAHSTWVWQ